MVPGIYSFEHFCENPQKTSNMSNCEDVDKSMAKSFVFAERVMKSKERNSTLMKMETQNNSPRKEKVSKKIKFGSSELCFFKRDGLVCDQKVVSKVSSKVALKYMIRKHQIEECYSFIKDLRSSLSAQSGQDWRDTIREINRLTELAEVLESPPEPYVYIPNEFEDPDDVLEPYMSPQEIWENECAVEAILSGLDDDFI